MNLTPLQQEIEKYVTDATASSPAVLAALKDPSTAPVANVNELLDILTRAASAQYEVGMRLAGEIDKLRGFPGA